MAKTILTLYSLNTIIRPTRIYISYSMVLLVSFIMYVTEYVQGHRQKFISIRMFYINFLYICSLIFD